jgi:hypothetical protein
MKWEEKRKYSSQVAYHTVLDVEKERRLLNLRSSHPWNVINFSCTDLSITNVGWIWEPKCWYQVLLYRSVGLFKGYQGTYMCTSTPKSSFAKMVWTKRKVTNTNQNPNETCALDSYMKMWHMSIVLYICLLWKYLCICCTRFCFSFVYCLDVCRVPIFQ